MAYPTAQELAEQAKARRAAQTANLTSTDSGGGVYTSDPSSEAFRSTLVALPKALFGAVVDPLRKDFGSMAPAKPAAVAPPVTASPIAPVAAPTAPVVPVAPVIGPKAMPQSMLQQTMGMAPKPMQMPPTERAPQPALIDPASRIAQGIGQQGAYAQTQQDRALEGAKAAAGAGNPLNATARYNAAIGALSPLGGANNFAGLQEQSAAAMNAANANMYGTTQGAVTAANALAGAALREGMQTEMQNIASKRSAAAHGYSTDTQMKIAEMMPHPIGSTATIDPVTKLVTGTTTNYATSRNTPGGVELTTVDKPTSQQAPTIQVGGTYAGGDGVHKAGSVTFEVKDGKVIKVG